MTQFLKWTNNLNGNFLQRLYAKSQETYGKVPIITNHEGANQN